MHEHRFKHDVRRGHSYLALAGISCLLIYGALLARFPLLGLYQVPLQNLNRIDPAEWPKGLLVIGCVVFLFGGYLLGAYGLASAPEGRRTALLVVGFALSFVALLVFTQPMTSTDLYDYLFRGRMLAHYGANPFVTTPNEFPDDPLLKYVAWKHIVTAYGPLWERMSWLTTRLAGRPAQPAEIDLLRLLLAYKGLAVLGYALCGAAIWAALKQSAPEQRWLGAYLWLWNPLVLWEGIGNGHNDVWMALAMVAAVWAFGQSKPGEREADHRSLGPAIAALVILTLGGAIKFATFFFGPVTLAAALRRLPSWRARSQLLLIGGGICLAFVVAAYAPFWAGWETIRNVGDRTALFNATWLAALHARLKLAIPEERAGSLVAWLSLALLLAGVAWASWRAWRAPHALAQHLLWLVLWFLLVCNAWFQPWYAIWPLGLAVLEPWRRRTLVAVNLLCLAALASYVVGGLLLPALGLEEKSAIREILLSLLLYLPPLIAFGWGKLGGLGAIPRRAAPGDDGGARTPRISA